ncbi:MAG: hypothetical protein RR636_13730 [Clostridium sp.]|uniref:hypothetical protein n=1 Tax=Clostridium sp. TaxID=1506 RepID=UPI00306B7B68
MSNNKGSNRCSEYSCGNRYNDCDYDWNVEDVNCVAPKAAQNCGYGCGQDSCGNNEEKCNAYLCKGKALAKESCEVKKLAEEKAKKAECIENEIECLTKKILALQKEADEIWDEYNQLNDYAYCLVNESNAYFYKAANCYKSLVDDDYSCGCCR